MITTQGKIQLFLFRIAEPIYIPGERFSRNLAAH